MNTRLAFNFYFVVFMVAGSSENGSHTTGTRHAPNFTCIGTADRKTYFAEQTLTMAWNDANFFYKASQMNLAKVTSIKQKRVLNYAHWSEPDGYWTGG